MIELQCVVVDGPFGLPMTKRLLMGDAGQPVKEPVKVYRVEMPNGKGPYNSDLPDAKDLYMHLCLPEYAGGYNCTHLCREGEQMGVIDDPFRKAHGHANYGCLKIEHLHEWFPEGARKLLADRGAKIVEYEIPVGGYLMKIQNKEVLFNRYECTRVQEHQMVEREMAHAAQDQRRHAEGRLGQPR